MILPPGQPIVPTPWCVMPMERGAMPSPNEHEWSIIAAHGAGFTIADELTFHQAKDVCNAANCGDTLPWRYTSHEPCDPAHARGILSEQATGWDGWIANNLTEDQARKIVDAANSLFSPVALRRGNGLQQQPG